MQLMAAFQESFEGKVHNFLVSNVESFNNLTREKPLPLKPYPKSTDLYGDPLHLEFLMQVPIGDRRQSVLKLICPGDIVRGHVVVKTAVALGIQVTSLVGSWKARALVDLDIWGLVPVECLASDRDKCEVLEDMQVDDVVQAVVTGSTEAQLTLSFKMGDVSLFCPSGCLPEGVVLGYLEEGRPQKAVHSIDSSFLSDLKDSAGFANPCATENLKEALGIRGYNSQTKPTLILDMQNEIYLESDFSSSLRKKQRFKWSMETVAVGVKRFKEGDLNKALSLFHHALDIDPSNVEGLVARGALYANRNKYRRAITDFEAALTENCSHRNAKQYLVETRMAYGGELEEDGHLEDAAECYREALADDASQVSAKDKLNKINELLKRKADEKLERERKEAAERARIKKLHSLIKEERKRKERREVFTVELKSDTTKHKKRKKKKYKKKTKRRHDSTDEESLISSDTYSSRSHSPSTRRKGHQESSHYKSREDRYSRDSRSRDHRRHHSPLPLRRRRSSSRSLLVKDRMGGMQDVHSPVSLVSPGRKGRKNVQGVVRSRSSSSVSERSRRSSGSSASPFPSKKRRNEDKGRIGRHHRDYSRSPSLSPSRRRRRSRSRNRSRLSSERARRRQSSDSAQDRRTASPSTVKKSSKDKSKEGKKGHIKSGSSHHYEYHHHNS